MLTASGLKLFFRGGLASRCFGLGRLQLPQHGLQLKRLNDVARLDVVEILQSDTTFEISQHFAHVILEALERADLSFPHDPAVAHQSHTRATRDLSIHNHRTGNRAARDIENLAYFDPSQLLLAIGGCE